MQHTIGDNKELVISGTLHWNDVTFDEYREDLYQIMLKCYGTVIWDQQDLKQLV